MTFIVIKVCPKNTIKKRNHMNYLQNPSNLYFYKQNTKFVSLPRDDFFEPICDSAGCIRSFK